MPFNAPHACTSYQSLAPIASFSAQIQTNLVANLDDLSASPNDSLCPWHLRHPMVLEMMIQIVFPPPLLRQVV
jgi:hypothetical protein